MKNKKNHSIVALTSFWSSNIKKSGLLRPQLLCLILSVFISASSVYSQKVISGTDKVPYEIAPINAPFDMQQFERPTFQDKTFNIREYGAIELDGDKKHKNTKAIHLAIEAAHKAGGGKVLIPKGKWLTGPIHLMSNINLHLEDGATVYFSEDREDYLPVVQQRHEGVEAFNYSPMIYANKVKNVAITGKGIFDGQGEHWWEWGVVQPRAAATKVPLSRRDFGKGSGMEGMRPNFMVFWKSQNILIEDVTLIDGPMWNVHLVYSKNVIVRGITVNSLNAPNGDGVVIDSSNDVLLEYNTLKTGDDAVVLKSGFNEEGLEIDIPTENIVIRNFRAIDVRTGSGGVVFGSETSGGIRNVYVHDAYFEGCDRGIRFKTERGRGNVIENIFIRDVLMENINIEAINFNTFYTGPGAVGPSPVVRNIDIRNIKIDGVKSAIALIGLPEKWLENINLENIEVVNSEVGIQLLRVKDLTLKNVSVSTNARAMMANDVYEVTFENVSLKDKSDEKPLLIKGPNTGAIFMTDFPLDQIEFGDGLSEDIIKKELPVQTW